MAKNRKYQTASSRFGPALKAFFLCLIIGGSGVGYVWQKNQIYELGQQKKQREMRLYQLSVQNQKLEKTLAGIRTPTFLEQRIKTLNLVMPAASQVWRLPEPARDAFRPPLEHQYTIQENRAPGVP
jgi:hypothetical protein